MIDVGSAIGFLELDTSGFMDGLSSAKEELKGFKDETKSIGEKFSSVASGLTSAGSTLTKSVTLPILGIGTAAGAAATEFQKASQSIQVATGATETEMQKFDDVMKAIYDNNYGDGFEDIADAIVTVKQQLGDLDDEELQTITESAFAFRDAFDIEVAESIRSVDTLMTNFGTTSEEAFDLMTWGMQNGLNFSDELIDSINEYGPQFKKIGFSAEEMFKIFAQGAESGAWNLDKIGDAIKELSIRAIDGSDTTYEAYQTLGLSMDYMAASFAEGGEWAKEAFFEIIDGLNSLEDPIQRNIVGVNLFGTMWEDLGPEVIPQLEGVKNATLDVAGASEQLKTDNYQDLGSYMEDFRRSISLLGVELGEVFMPYVIQFVQWLTSLVDIFRNMPEGVQQVIVVIGLLLGALGPVLLILGKLAGAISSIMTLVSTVGPMVSGLGSVFAALTGPIGIAVAAIAGLFVAYQTNLLGIQDLVNSVLSFVTGLWQSNFLNVQDYFNLFWSNIQITLETAIALFQEVIGVFLAVLSGDWEAAWEGIKNIFSIIWEAINQLLQNYIEGIIIFVTNTGPRMLQAARDLFNRAKDGFTEVWENIKAWFSEAVNDPVGTIKGIGQDMYNAGVEIFNKLWDGAKSIWDGIVSWVEEKVDWIVDKVTFWKNKAEEAEDARDRAESYDDDPDGSHKNGLDYVPYDGYRAELHKGERVLTAEEAKEYKRSGGNTYNFYSPKALTPKEAAREMKRAERELALGFA